MVLLDHVDPEARDIEQVETKVVEIYDLLRRNKLVMSALVLGVVFVIALGILLSGKEKKQAQPTLAESQPIEVIPPQQTVIPTTPIASEVDRAPSAEQSHTPAVIEQIPPVTVAGKNSPDGAHSQSATKGEELRDGDKLFRDRRGATASWVAGAYRGAYTIQLMMLASDQAQTNITSMLIQDEYFPLKEHFYILRKKGAPPTLFVFYGIYDTMDAARDARNNMPVFLRKHHPYPLSIGDALKKGEN